MDNPRTRTPTRRRLHVTRAARRRYGLPEAAFGLTGRLLELDPGTAHEWARRISEERDRSGAASPVSAGELAAAVALHELMHALIDVVTGAPGPYRGAFARAATELHRSVGNDAARELFARFTATFEPADAGGSAAAEEILEELLLISLAQGNGAFAPLHDLFAAPEMVALTAHRMALSAVGRELSAATVSSAPRRAGPLAGGTPDDAWTLGLDAPTGVTLLALLRAPQTTEPTSLLGQLRTALSLWTPLLGERYAGAVARALRARDLLAEEQRRGPVSPGPPPAVDPARLLSAGEPEAFTADRPWMPGVTLVAKSTFVWLAQLARRYGRQVERLDQVPDEALRELHEYGFDTLWLIGVWQRSAASRTIKRLRGQPDAVASAYSVHDYVIAPELGGEAALADLAERAAAHGLRLASDMVPNHAGIDSRWVAEHPERFVQTAEPPYPGYRFTGPDLSEDARMSVRIEDGYYDGSDAAVVFQRVDAASGEVRYLYHGNDGTALPWNDTAQLDFLRADVRAAVIDATVAVARRFPVIRFDAAMTLAKRHVRRLWHPPPGAGGAIPSRSGQALSEEEFERAMPREFWRELVERLARDAPDTLLLAEAFWMMEVYFVRSLGLHRVYNSAFMHMTMKEENAAYRLYLKRYLATEPRVLERFVNYMSNPDEESAAEQYGDGDKAFGVATLLATLPGLPMFGHGQVEGLREKYGMEFQAPRTWEEPVPELVERHRREIAPLLRRRDLFAGAAAFRLFELVGQGGAAEEDVFLFVNGSGEERALVAYNNGPRRVSGRALLSVPYLDGERGSRRERLAAALVGGRAPGAELVLTELRTGDRLTVPVEELERAGLALTLEPYQARVFVVGPKGWGNGEGPGGHAVPLGVPEGSRRPRSASALLAGRRGVAARRRARRRRR